MKNQSRILTVCSVGLAIFSAISLAFVNVGFFTGYRFGIYPKTTMQNFLNEEEFFCRMFFNQTQYGGAPDAEALRACFDGITLTEENNRFPYQVRPGEFYQSITIRAESYSFYMNEECTNAFLACRADPGDSIVRLEAVRYFVCSREDGLKLKNFLMENTEVRG